MANYNPNQPALVHPLSEAAVQFPPQVPSQYGEYYQQPSPGQSYPLPGYAQGYQQQPSYTDLKPIKPKPRSRMRSFFLAVLAFTAAVGGAALKSYHRHDDQGANPPPRPNPVVWQTFTSEQGGFTFQMPGKPEQSSRPLHTEVGDLTVLIFQFTKANDLSYGVMYLDSPIGFDDPEAIMLRTIKKDGAKLRSQQEIHVQGNSGYEAEYETADGLGYVWHRVVIVENRIYQQIVAASKSAKELYAADVEKFFDAFEFSQ